MKAKVISLHKKPTLIDGKPVKVGDVVNVGECTFRNLANKGVLEAADAQSQEVELDEPSKLTEAEVAKQKAALVAEREAKKERDEAAKGKK